MLRGSTAFICFVLVFKLPVTQKFVSTSWNSDIAQCQSAKGQSLSQVFDEESGTNYRGPETRKRSMRLRRVFLTADLNENF